MAEKPLISFQGASFSYDGEHPVFEGLNLGIKAGTLVCLAGGNGSGKSTIAKHMNALLTPSAGAVFVDGRDTREPGNVLAVRSSVGFVFQNPDDQLVASLVENDVAFGPENLGVERAELRERVTQSLEAVGLAGLERRETNTLSGGQKQRLAIAGALALKPRVLVLDEATSMLDPRGRAAVLNIALTLRAQGTTVLMITHFMEEAALADRIIVLDRGKIALDGDPESVLADASTLESLSLEPPFPARMSRTLIDAGVRIAPHANVSALKEELCALRSSR